MRNSLLIYAHWDPEDRIRPYVRYALKQCRPLFRTVAFGTNCERIDGGRLKELRKSCCDFVLKRKNEGFDFGIWKSVLESIPTNSYDEVVLLNSSVYGPVGGRRAIESMFERMDEVECDFWGQTSSFEVSFHIQSYFLVFRKNPIDTGAFGDFFGSVDPTKKNKTDVIMSYEVGGSNRFFALGFESGAFIKHEDLSDEYEGSIPLQYTSPRRKKGLNGQRPTIILPQRKQFNPMWMRPVEIVDKAGPFVKIELWKIFRSDEKMFDCMSSTIRHTQSRMAMIGYDMNMVDGLLEPEPKESKPK